MDVLLAPKRMAGSKGAVVWCHLKVYVLKVGHPVMLLGCAKL